MAESFTDLAALRAAGFDDWIDVRSPAEFAEDHLPGAINLPVLSNAERAEVGTIYVQESRFRAKRIGAAKIARAVARHLDGPLSDRPAGWRPLVYCWRGGQRSGAMATILTQIGWRAETLSGGYRSWRRHVVAALYDTPLAHRLVLLDGNTGTGKTALLPRLAERGVQVIDLEGLAAHRGSLFGGVAEPQPAQKLFDSRVMAALSALDAGRVTVVEAESNHIGRLLVPPSLWAAMKLAPRIAVSAPLPARAAFLARAYADIVADGARLEATLEALVRLRGREVVEGWRTLAAAGQFEALAERLMAEHYDPTYHRSRARNGPPPARTVTAEALDEAGLERLADGVFAALGEVAPARLSA